ncbi:MAG: SufS family cysteine desulfurase [Patescibacteria group bacterium]
MNIEKIRADFPVLANNPDLVYLDSAASGLVSRPVIETVNKYFTEYPVNIHRGLYKMSATASELYEQARSKIANFLNASDQEIIFTSGATHSLNLVANITSRDLRPGDNVVLTRYEHHANLVPWQQMAKRFGFSLRFIELNKDTYLVDETSIETVIDKNTKIVSFSLASNALGTIPPTDKIISAAKLVGALVIADAAQAIMHLPIDVKKLGVDFLAFSGHKIYGPRGTGVLFGRKELLEKYEPFFFGGDMIAQVTYEDATWADLPAKFEAGTPNICGLIGLGAAIDYLESIGWEAITAHEREITAYLVEKIQTVATLIGTTSLENRVGSVSFILDGIHTHDTADILDKYNVCVRAGHHCAMPLMRYLNLNGTTRASLGIYSTKTDVDRLIEGIAKVKTVFEK